ncbi:MAG: PEP-utilizing enzyme [bacterium]|nr:PEP-utilizing enzyme [bacterium]
MPKVSVIPESDRFQWGPIDGVPFYLGLAGFGCVQRSWELYGHGWPAGDLLFYDRHYAIWYGRDSQISVHGIQAAQKFYLKPAKLRALKLAYQRQLRIFAGARQFVKTHDVNKLPDEDLLHFLNRLVEVYHDFWGTTIQPELTGYGMHEYFVKHMPRFFTGDRLNEALSILSSPDDFSFYQKEELIFLKIVAKVRADGKTITHFRQAVERKQPAVFNLIKKHASEYSWLAGSYANDAPLPESWFWKRARDIVRNGKTPDEKINEIRAQFQKIQRSKRRLIEELPSGRLKKYARDVVGDAVAWQDDRKGWQFRVQEVLRQFLDEIARRRRVKKEDLRYLLWSELWSWANGALEWPAREIKARKKCVLLHIEPRHFVITTGTPATVFQNHYRQPKLLMREMRGVVASAGGKETVKGKVMILRHARESGKFPAGRILVAELTSPDYIGAMRKAKAIITDHGGLTSHAAVVSRELNLPSIVGTKHASHVLRNEDEVEMDLRKGTISKLTSHQ